MLGIILTQQELCQLFGLLLCGIHSGQAVLDGGSLALHTAQLFGELLCL